MVQIHAEPECPRFVPYSAFKASMHPILQHPLTSFNMLQHVKFSCTVYIKLLEFKFEEAVIKLYIIKLSPTPHTVCVHKIIRI